MSCRSFFNVLKDDMSPIGPRSEGPHLAEQLDEAIPHYNACGYSKRDDRLGVG